MLSCASGNDWEIILVGTALIISERKELELKRKSLNRNAPRMPKIDKDQNELQCSPDCLSDTLTLDHSAGGFCFVFFHFILHASVLCCFSIYVVEIVAQIIVSARERERERTVLILTYRRNNSIAFI